jgi:aspartyl-tRNA(Asn)/glutamyl-tRNA(Gln) amidotransferase subunit C
MPPKKKPAKQKQQPKITKPKVEQISIAIVKRVAAVARLELTEAELQKFQSDLSNILDAFKILDKAKVSGIDPSFQPLPVKDVLRKDEIESYLGREKALDNTKHKQEGHFKGPKVV